MTEFEQIIVQMLESIGNAVNTNTNEKVESAKKRIPTLESLLILPCINDRGFFGHVSQRYTLYPSGLIQTAKC